MRALLLATIFVLALPGDSTAALSAYANTEAEDLHFLNRISFGPTTKDLECLKSMGRESYIHHQLNPVGIDESADVTAYVQSCDALNRSPLDLFARYGPPAIMAKSRSADNTNSTSGNTNSSSAGNNDNSSTNAKMQARRELFGDITQQTITARLLREIDSTRQLEEVMTDFWFNHFNVSIDKGLDHLWTGAYEEQAIRPYALGKFRDLLEATSHHPAMLFYLDNWENTAPGSPGARGNFTGINENYAREVMELHTLGVDGGYTQKDVTELARILTGLGLPKPNAGARRIRPRLIASPTGLARFGLTSLLRSGVRNYAGGQRINKYGSVFYENRHDFGDKIFLGQTIQGQGEQEIEKALDMLAAHPSTAHHISYELAQYFVSDEPPASLVDKLTTKFMQTNGDIKAVMNELLHSDEFWDPDCWNCKYKSPLRYAVSVLRVADMHPENLRPVQGFLNQQGMKLYGCLTPDGYKNTKDAWLNSGALLQRLSFATKVGLGRLPGSNGAQPADYTQIESGLAGLQFSDKTRQAVDTARPLIKTTLLLGSPEFMWY